MANQFRGILRRSGRMAKVFAILVAAVGIVVAVAYGVYASGPPIVVEGMVSPAMMTIPRPGGGRPYRYNATAMSGGDFMITRDGTPWIIISNAPGAHAALIKDPNGNKAVVAVKAPSR